MNLETEMLGAADKTEIDVVKTSSMELLSFFFLED